MAKLGKFSAKSADISIYEELFLVAGLVKVFFGEVLHSIINTPLFSMFSY